MFWRPKKGGVVGVVNIGSSSAAVGIIDLPEKGPASLHSVVRSALQMQERAKEATIAGIGAELEKAAVESYRRFDQKGKHPPVREIFCVVHEPWVHSNVVSKVVRHQIPTTVTKQLMSVIAQDALKGAGSQNEHPLEAGIVRTELDGYPTAKPVGKNATGIAVSIMVSEWDLGLGLNLQQRVEKVFPHVPVRYLSFTRAILSSLAAVDAIGQDQLVVNLMGQGTTLSAIRGGVIAEQRYIEEGVQSILRRIAPAGIPEETLALIKMVHKGQCATPACDALRTSIEKIEHDLVKAYGDALSALAQTRKLPNALTLVGHPDMLDWFAAFFSRIDFTQFTQTAQPFIVEPLTVDRISPIVVGEPGMVADIGIFLSAALATTEGLRE